VRVSAIVTMPARRHPRGMKMGVRRPSEVVSGWHL
jgi:hypothetical protein